MTEDASYRRAKVIILALCVIAAGTIAAAAAYRYLFWGDQLPGGFAASPVDLDRDGAPEYLITRSVVELPESGDYAAGAALLNPSTGAAIATTSGHVELDRGENVFGAGFWAPDIRESEISGPYIVRLTFVREQSDELFEPAASPDMVGRAYTWDFTTPAYDWRTFQEQPVAVSIAGPVTSVRTDADSDGRADSYEIDVPLAIRAAGSYAVRAGSDKLALQGVTDRFVPPDMANAGLQFVSLQPGAQTVRLSMAAQTMYLSGIDGPVDFRVTVSDVQVENDFCGCGPGRLVEKPQFAPPPDGDEVGLRQPYVLPPTPLGLKAETRFEETLHWYDFEAPWMPIEFTGATRDYGTDVDGDGQYDYLTVEADVRVHQVGVYDLSGTLYAQGAEPTSQVLMRSVPTEEYVVTTAWTRITINDWEYVGGVQTVRLEFAGAEILAAGLDGPYDAKLRVVPANVIIDPVVVHTTAAYGLAQFEATGAKAARLGHVTVSPGPQSGEFLIGIDANGIGSSHQVLVRVIHANGVVSLDTSFWAGGTGTFVFSTGGERAKDFAVAVYLMDPSGTGVDYIELTL